MKTIVIAKNRDHLIKLVKKEVRKNNQCDLNYIDVSEITDMAGIFSDSRFNGDISKWNTSKVTIMSCMFLGSHFNGDISNWDVSNVKKMDSMFCDSKFNNDVSKWNVSNVVEMYAIFASSEFKGDLSNWKPYNLKGTRNTFLEQLIDVPYWATIEDKEKRNIAIDNHELNKELNMELIYKINQNKKLKI